MHPPKIVRPSSELVIFRIFMKFLMRPLFTLVTSFPRQVGFLFQGLNFLVFHSMVRSWRNKVSLVVEMVGGVSVYWFRPREQTPNPSEKLIIYVHGGGFVTGSFRTYAATMAEIASKTRCSVAFIEYSLAPKHVYPQALNQISLVYEKLMSRQFSPERTVIGGDSAGGNLVLAFLVRNRDRGKTNPGATFLESPFTDLTFSGRSFKKNWWRDCLLPQWPPISRYYRKGMERLYCGENNACHPYLSPLFADLSGLPPLHVCYSKDEMLCDDAERLISKARNQGVLVSSFSQHYTPHVNFLFSPYYPEARIGLQSHLDFLGEFFSSGMLENGCVRLGKF